MSYSVETLMSEISREELILIEKLERDAYRNCDTQTKIHYLHALMLMQAVPDLFATVIARGRYSQEVIAFDFNLATTAWMIFMLEDGLFDEAISSFKH